MFDVVLFRLGFAQGKKVLESKMIVLVYVRLCFLEDLSYEICSLKVRTEDGDEVCSKESAHVAAAVVRLLYMSPGCSAVLHFGGWGLF